MNARLLFLAPLLVAFVPPLALEEEILFAPSEGATFTVTYTNELEMSMADQSVTLTINGEENDQETPDFELTLSQSFEATFQDTVVSSADGRVTKLSRTFEEIAQTRSQEADTPDGAQSNDETGESDLAGTTVVFSWDDEEEGYTVAFGEDEDGDEELLEELEFDIYFAGMLPDSAVSVGDSWSPDISALTQINDPGGDLQINWEDTPEEDEDDDLGQQYEDNLDGTIDCKLAEIVDEDGARVAIIELAVEASTSSTKGDEIDNQGISGTIGEDVEITFDFTGVLRWNLDAGHAVALELGGDIAYTIDSSQDLARESETFLMEMQRSFEGTNTMTCTIEAGSSEE